MKKKVLNGCDLLNDYVSKNILLGKKLGLISNSRALTKESVTTAFQLASLYNLCALFSGEHGFNTKKQAGEYDENIFIDTLTGVPVYNLFGGEKHLRKAEEIFEDLDALVFDFQDIGTRYYTYQYTLLDALYLCKKTNKELVILDRINPLGCLRIEGNLLEENCVSEVGRVPGQPVIGGMTIGEIALWYNTSLHIKAKVNIIPCEGLQRNFLFEDTDITFTPPSPNMCNLTTIFLYAGTCLFEGTNLSEGRGTDKPFELFGAPWMDSRKVIDYLYSLPNEQKACFEGLRFHPCSFTPEFSDYKGVFCNGIEIEIRSKNNVNMFETGLQLISAIKCLYPNHFKWEEHLSNLAGTKEIYNSDFNPYEYIKKCKPLLNKFSIGQKEFLIY